ncbi:MAG TPA: 4-carboxymuconolactone decarboxylase [Stellaceae bacterium]|nr:4-carboxymuconolactone decarboxylase [Stellaceae bacterium]
MSMIAELYKKGMDIRTAVLGRAHVERAKSRTTPFNEDFQNFITQYAWGSVWSRPGLERKARSMLVLGMLAALGRTDEFKLHVRATRNTGVTRDEIKEILLMVAVYGGVPAANSAFHHAAEVLTEMDKETSP